VFKVVSRDYSDRSSAVNLTYTSPDGEEGYPGTLELTVRYELLAHSPELQITFSATTDKATPGKTHTPCSTHCHPFFFFFLVARILLSMHEYACPPSADTLLLLVLVVVVMVMQCCCCCWRYQWWWGRYYRSFHRPCAGAAIHSSIM
jgi:hypothetical protein